MCYAGNPAVGTKIGLPVLPVLHLGEEHPALCHSSHLGRAVAKSTPRRLPSLPDSQFPPVRLTQDPRNEPNSAALS